MRLTYRRDNKSAPPFLLKYPVTCSMKLERIDGMTFMTAFIDRRSFWTSIVFGYCFVMLVHTNI
jgi:hypothetical protein